MQRLHEEIEPELTLPPTAQLLTGLQRHFAGIEQHADAHTLLLGVAAADEEVAAIVARDREAFAERVLAGMPGAAGSSPLARATARAWIGSVEAATREFIAADGEVTAQQLVAVLAESLVSALLAAARLDPSIEVPPGIDGLAGGGIVDAIVASWPDGRPPDACAGDAEHR